VRAPESRKALLIFDNCEQVVSACASLANAILRAAPTSGSSLRAAKRRGFRASRSIPCCTGGARPHRERRDAVSLEAVQLFIARAQLQKPGFADRT
jgi:predicted ATPase